MKKMDIVKRRTVEFSQVDEDNFQALKKHYGMEKDADVFRKLLLDRVITLSVPTETKQAIFPPEKKSEKKQEGNLTAVVNEEIGFSEVPIIVDTVIQPIGKPLLPPPGFKISIVPPVVIGKPKSFAEKVEYWVKQGVPEVEARSRALLAK